MGQNKGGLKGNTNSKLYYILQCYNIDKPQPAIVFISHGYYISGKQSDNDFIQNCTYGKLKYNT